MQALYDYIKHYDELSYDTQSLHNRHLRAKKTSGTTPLELKIKAYSRFAHLGIKFRAQLNKIYLKT